MGAQVATDVLCIGDGHTGSSADRELDAGLAEIAVFRKVLNQREVTALYEAKDGYNHAHSGDAIDIISPGLRHRGLAHLVSRKSG